MSVYKKVKKKPITHPALLDWYALNGALRGADPTLCKLLLRKEQAGRKRAAFLKRVQGRLAQATLEEAAAKAAAKTKKKA